MKSKIFFLIFMRIYEKEESDYKNGNKNIIFKRQHTYMLKFLVVSN